MRWFVFGKPGSVSLTLDRLNALSDGVIAIVLTLLVLGIDVPKDHNFSRDGLTSYLLKIEHEVTVYAVSFVLIATFWIIQSVMFHFFQHGNRTLIWLNLLFLFVLTLLPFTTQLVGSYKQEPRVIVVYGVVNAASSLSLALIWWYANNVGAVVWPRINPTAVRSMMLRILLGAGVSLVAIGAAFLNVRLAYAVFLTMPLLYLSHRNVDAHWSEIVDTGAEEH